MATKKQRIEALEAAVAALSKRLDDQNQWVFEVARGLLDAKQAKAEVREVRERIWPLFQAGADKLAELLRKNDL